MPGTLFKEARRAQFDLSHIVEENYYIPMTPDDHEYSQVSDT